jgi:molybdopterin/thiamine biosynthesis adenylyltransferase/rhodanese-related sulfurtransferase
MADESKIKVLSPAELARYSRHILLPEVGVDGQAKLASSSALVIGAGGLGSPIALYLAAAGVGTIGVAEFDRIEEHNLQRQILHDTASVGAPKAESARARIEALNPHVKVVLHESGVGPANAETIFRNYDVIVDGTDNFPTRYLNNDAAFFASKPLVYGSIFQFEGQVSVFHPAGGAPCYRCLFPEPPPPGSVPNCGEAGVLGALCGVIGSLQAMEAIKVLIGIGEPLRGRLLVFDALASEFRTLKLRKDPECPLCGAHPKITAIDPARYEQSCAPAPAAAVETDEEIPIEVDVHEAARLAGNGHGAVILDVREPFEHAIGVVEGSLLVPMRHVPEAIGDLPGDKPILVICHTGVRSLRVAEFLRARGFENAASVAGGIAEWSREIDASIPRY